MQQSIEENSKSINELSATIKSAQASFNIYYQKSNNEELAKEKQKLDTLTGITTEIETQNSNLDSVNKDIKDLTLSISNAVITAPIDGTVSLYNEINQADYIQSGLNIGTIVPDSVNQFKVLIYIRPSDISKIKVNQQIKLRFTSLSYKEYGEFDARLINISADTKTNSTTNTSYYTAECVLSEEKTKYYSYRSIQNDFSTLADKSIILDKSQNILDQKYELGKESELQYLSDNLKIQNDRYDIQKIKVEKANIFSELDLLSNGIYLE